MLHAVLKISVKRIDQAFIARQNFKRNRIDEICGVLRHNNRNIRALFFQHAGKRSDFKSCNAARYAEYDMFSL